MSKWQVFIQYGDKGFTQFSVIASRYCRNEESYVFLKAAEADAEPEVVAEFERARVIGVKLNEEETRKRD